MSAKVSSHVIKGVKNKDTAQLLRRAVKAGCHLSHDGGGHVKISAPSGNVLRIPKTSASWHAHKRLWVFLKGEGIIR